MKVAFFGAFDPSYPRNVVLREGLESHGADVSMVAVPPNARAVAREGRLALRGIAALAGLDALLVPAFSHRDVPLAALIGRLARVPVLFDPLVSRWDTQVQDLGRVRRGSFTAGRMRFSDDLALSAADLVLCDTWEHGDLYSSEYRVPGRKLCRVPVGADHGAFSRGDRRTSPHGAGPLEVVYVGGFLPLHGVATVIDAATILEARHGHDFARFTLIGSGMTAPQAERDVAARGLRSVRRLPRVPYDEALDALAEADVALGIFGATPKAGRVVPHKVYQAMAIGVPTVTRRSRAIGEFFREGDELCLVAPGDAEALAGAVEGLARDPDYRRRLGAAGRAAVQVHASPERVGALLLEAIGRARDLALPRGRR